MGWVEDKTGIDLNPINVLTSAVNTIGDVVGGAMNIVSSNLSSIGNTVQGILKDPLPTVLQIGGAMIGIPPYVTAAVVTGAKGGSFEDIAKSAAISYASSEFLSSTQIGADIREALVNTPAGDFTDTMIEQFGLPVDTAVSVAKAATASLNNALVGGINSALTGKNVMEGITSGFTSGLIYSGTDSYFNELNKDPNWGFSPKALDLMKGATTTALNTIVSGKGDPAQAVGNYITYATLRLGSSEIYKSVTKAYEDFTGKTAAAEKAQDAYVGLKAQFDVEANRYNAGLANLKTYQGDYQKIYDEEYTPITNQLNSYKSTFDQQKGIYDNAKASYDANKWAYENYDAKMTQMGYEYVPDESGDAYRRLVGGTRGLLPDGEGGHYWAVIPDGTILDNDWNPVVRYAYDAPSRESFAAAANESATIANAAYANATAASNSYTALSESEQTKNVISRMQATEKSVTDTVATLSAIKKEIEVPSGDNLAARLKAASEKYQKEYDNYATSKAAADRASENYTKIVAEVATRDATIDAINSGAIKVVGQGSDGSYQLSNGMTLKDGKFWQDDGPVFTNAAGISQKGLEFFDGSGNLVKYGSDVSPITIRRETVPNELINQEQSRSPTVESETPTGGLPDSSFFNVGPGRGPAVSPAGDSGPAIIRDSLSFPDDPEAMGYQGSPRPLSGSLTPVGVPESLSGPLKYEPAPLEPSPITVRRELIPDELVNQEQTREQISNQVFDQLTQLFEDRDPTTLKLAAELAVNHPWDFDPNIPTPLTPQNLTQYGKGLVSAVENITKGAPILLALQADAWNVEKAQTALQRFDLIDDGKLNEAVKPVQGSIYGMRLLSQYANASPERRLEMRQEQQANIENSVSGAREGIRLYEAFRKDMEQYKPNIPNFTDIRTDNIGDLAKDFGDWLAFNVGAGGPSVATSILGALVAGPAGALAVGSTLGTAEALANRVEYLRKAMGDLPPEQQGRFVVDYLEKTGGASLLTGMTVGTLDTIFGPVGSAIRNNVFKQVADQALKQSVVTAVKAVPREAIEEFFTGGAQELTQIVGQLKLGEKEGALLTVDNLKRILNSAAAEAAGVATGSGINISTAAGAQQWKTMALESALIKMESEIGLGKKIYPDILNPSTPEEAARITEATNLLSNPATQKSVSERDLYGEGMNLPLTLPKESNIKATRDEAGNVFYDMGSGFIAVEPVTGSFRIINSTNGQTVPLSPAELFDVYETTIAPYKAVHAEDIVPIIEDRPVVQDTIDKIAKTLTDQPSQVRPSTNDADSKVVTPPPVTDTTTTPVDTTAKTVTLSDQDITRIANSVVVPAGLSETDVRRIITDVIATSPGLSSTDVTSIVNDAISKLPTAPTAKDISDRISAATKDFATKADIDTAIANIQFPPGLSKEDVTTAITDYMTKNPGLTLEQVATKITDATAGLATTEAVKTAIGDALKGYATTADINTAIANIKFPPGISKEDVTTIVKQAFTDNPGLTKADVQGVVDAAIKLLPAAPTIADITAAFTETTKTFATKADIDTAISNIKFPPGISKEDVTTAITDYMTKNPGLNAADVTKVITDYMTANPPLNKEDVTKIVADAGTLIKNSLAATEKTILDEVAKNEAAGLKRDDALKKAIEDVAKTQGTDVATLTKQIADSQSTLGKEISAVSTALGDAESRLNKAINDAVAAGQKGDAALQTAIDTVATDLGKSKTDILAQIGKSEEQLKTDFSKQLSGVSTQITDAESRLNTAISDAVAAGQKGDAALQTAIDKVAGDVGVTREDLLGRLGKTEEQLRTDFASQISGVQTQIGQVQNSLTQAISDAISAGKTGDAALQAGLDKVAGDLGIAKADLLSQLGKSEQQLREDFAGQIGGVQEQIGGVESRLTDAIAQARAAGLQGDQALQSAIDKVSGDLGIARSDLLSQLGKTEQQLKADLATQIGGVQQQIESVETRLSDAIAQARVAGLQGDQALQSAINKVSGDLGIARTDLLDQLGKTEQQLRTDLSAQIGEVQQQVGEQIAGVGSQVQSLAAQTQQQYADMTAAQKAEVDARVQMGQSLEAAIGTVQQNLIQSTQNIQASIANLSQITKAQYDELDEEQKKEVAARVQQGATLEGAIGTVRSELVAASAKTAEELAAIQKKMDDEKAAREAAARASAARGASEKLMQQSQQLIARPSADAAVTQPETPTAAPLTTGPAEEKKFQGPLAEFFQKVQETSYTQPPSQTMQPVQQVPQQPQQAQQAPQSNYFSYGVANEIDSILNPMKSLGMPFTAAQGGLATPLMAGGGALDVVHYAGKQRMDFRKGAAVSGPGDGQSDDIPAMLADGEFVFPADVVAALGNGSTKAGSDKLYDMMHAIRAHHRNAKPEDLPPPAKKSPLDYLKGRR